MLTEAEKKWMKARRGNRCKGGYFAFTSDSIMDFVRYGGVLTPDYKDAAEFEARVARSLAIFRHINQDEFYNLKRARLAVEEEMQ